MLVPKIGQGKTALEALEALVNMYSKRTPRLEVIIVEPLIDKTTRLQWLAKLNPKYDTYQKFKEKFKGRIK